MQKIEQTLEASNHVPLKGLKILNTTEHPLDYQY